ncbi:septum formation family protein [Embleya sp. NPDC005575]|uniref:septum formation family protein n=1 Tax=Embleya sp. NPDC005575 TaxID=3156892 RepID=UPI0033B73DAA
MRVSRFSSVSSAAHPGRRRVVARSSAAAVAVLVASTLLTGCLGKDDDKKKDDKGSSTGSKPPMITMPPAPTLPAKTDPSAGRTTGGGGAATPSGTATKSTGRVKMVKLHKGECINEKGEDLVTVVCTSPHDAEVVGEFTLPSNMSPTSMTFQEDTGKKCTELVSGAAERNSNLQLSKLTLRPTSGSWINENDRDLTCLLKRTDHAPLTAPLK